MSMHGQDFFACSMQILNVHVHESTAAMHIFSAVVRTVWSFNKLE